RGRGLNRFRYLTESESYVDGDFGADGQIHVCNFLAKTRAFGGNAVAAGSEGGEGVHPTAIGRCWRRDTGVDVDGSDGGTYYRCAGRVQHSPRDGGISLSQQNGREQRSA